jgi:lysophospholipase L1-like esterase
MRNLRYLWLAALVSWLSLDLCGARALADDEKAKSAPSPAVDPDPARFSEEIAAFARADKDDPPVAGGTVFVGSSSIRLWKLAESFPDLPARNRGFGGSQISDVVHWAEEVVLRYEPSRVVFFCGGNDIASGKSPEQVLEDFREFEKLLFAKCPRAELLLLAIKPSPRRAKHIENVRRANELLRAAAEKNERIRYLAGGFDLLVDGDGHIREELYVEDGIHLNAAGYALWTRMLEPHLRRDTRP